MELDSADFSVFAGEDLLGVQEGHELAAFMLGSVGFFWNGSHVLDTLAESDKDSSSATSKGRCGTIESSISSTENNNISVKLWQLALT